MPSESSGKSLEEIREKLRQEVLDGLWADLKPHLERGAVFLVATELDLVEVGACAVVDQVDQVMSWVEHGKLSRPTQQQIESWNRSADRLFHFLIVAPYVFIQERAH
jgi:hypothetical protein